MNKITLYSRKFSYRDEDEVLQNLSFEYIDRHLWSGVDVHQSVTVRTLMEIMKTPSVAFWQHALTEPLLPDLIEHYEECLSSKGKSPFDYLLFHWHGELWEWKDKEKNEDEEIHIGLDVSGYIEDDPENESGIYGLTFAPLKDLIDAPIRVNKEFKIWILGDKHKEKSKSLSLGLRTPTLIELMKAFVYESTFLGTEDNKRDQLEEMERRIEDVQSGNAKLIEFDSSEDFLEQMKKRIEDQEDEENLT